MLDIQAIFLVFVAATLISWVAIRTSSVFLQRYRDTFTQTARNSLADMFLFLDPARLFYMNMAAMVTLPTLTWFATENLMGVAGAVAGTAVLPRLVYSKMRDKRWRRFSTQLPDAVNDLSASLKAGASLTMAMESLVKGQRPPLSQEFELLLREQRVGVNLDKALDNMTGRVPDPDFQLVAASISISREIGGNLAETLESLGTSMRQKNTMEGKVMALTAQGRLQGIVMSALPVLLGAIMFYMEPEVMGMLFTTSVGWVVLGVIVFMEAMGYFMIKKITAVDV